MTHHANPTKILHTILENIAYKAESNDVTLYIVYPLTDTPRIQPIPRLYKNHLMGGIPWTEFIILSRTKSTTQRYW